MELIAQTFANAFQLVLIFASFLAIPLSLLILKRYDSVVTRAMTQSPDAQFGEAMSMSALRPTPPAVPLRIVEIELPPKNSDLASEEPLFRYIKYRSVATACVYSLAGAAYAATMAYAWLVLTKDELRPATKVAVLFLSYFWPTVLALAFVIAWSRKARYLSASGYWMVLLMIFGWAMARNPDLGFFSLLFYWVGTAGIPTLVYACVTFPRVRAVGPLVLPPLALLLLGFTVLFLASRNSDSAIRILTDANIVLTKDAIPIFWGLAIGAACTPPVIGWQRLRALAVKYERKELSDEGLLIDSTFLFFAVLQSIVLAYESFWGAVLFATVAYVAYRIVVTSGMHIAARLLRPPHPTSLLLLRVFSLRRPAERLFSMLRKVWLRQGPLAMLAGPDLARSTVDPPKVVQFIRGKLMQQFVGDHTVLDKRVREARRTALPDGRYSLEEFFFQGDAWRPAIERLIKECDVVLMDLRAFSSRQQGCLYELARLLDAIDLRRVLFLIDGTTDRALLEGSLHELWSATRSDSPNRALETPTATLLLCDHSPERALSPMLYQLLIAAHSIKRYSCQLQGAQASGSS